MEFYHLSYNQKENWENIKKGNQLQCILWSLFVVSLIFIFIALVFNKINQDLILLYDCGIGLLCSSIVSLAFLYIQKMETRRKLTKKRLKFFDNFYIYCYNILNDLPSIKRENCKLNCENYIIEVHREYHEYYKKIIASNYNDLEMKRLSNSIMNFYYEYHTWFENSHDLYKMNIECFSAHDAELLNDFFLYFEQLKLEINNDIANQLLAMAKLMTIFRRMIYEIKYLSSLQFIEFEFKNKELNIILDKFYEQEPFIKGIDDIGKAKHNNIIKYYSKKDSDD